jgi:cell division protein FtsB
MMEFISKINNRLKSISWLNKYTLTILCFVVWILFLDRKHSVVKQIKLNRQITELKNSERDYKVKLADARSEYADLTGNKEKFAREKYYISKKGEDVYIIQ